jgi:hypothetical protein
LNQKRTTKYIEWMSQSQNPSAAFCPKFVRPDLLTAYSGPIRRMPLLLFATDTSNVDFGSKAIRNLNPFKFSEDARASEDARVGFVLFHSHKHISLGPGSFNPDKF